MAAGESAPPKAPGAPGASHVHQALKDDWHEEDGLPEYAEFDLARRFTERYGAVRKYVPQWRTWIVYDGARWARDELLSTFDAVRAVCKEVALAAATEKIAAAIAAAKTVAAVERLARADVGHAMPVRVLDADDYLLNTPGGTVDLRTGELRPHESADYLTKCTAVAPDFAADGAAWVAFLDDVTCGDVALQDYLARFFGMCLSGSTREHALVFFLGAGGNGKSTLLELMLYILGDYGKLVPSEMLLELRGERHPTDIASLVGVRFAVASEVDEGRTWSETRVKTLTADEVLTARFMRGDFFEFKRTHKLLVVGNHQPALRTVDDAIRRRLHLVPFKARFTGDSIDRDMPAKLRAESPAVLAWAIRGALAWQSEGLAPPPAVTSATEDYLATHDALGEWLAQACLTADPEAWCESARLYASYKAWRERRGERVPSLVRFSGQLEQRFRKVRRGGHVRFSGIELRDADLLGAGST